MNVDLSLRLGDHRFHIQKRAVIQISELFDSNPDLYDDLFYRIQSEVDFGRRDFVPQFPSNARRVAADARQLPGASGISCGNWR
jgi:hypothetical protein